jgi:hypothetical protein
MKRFVMIGLLVIALMPGLAVRAQDGGECDLPGAVDAALEQLAAARDLETSEALAALAEVRSGLSKAERECLGLDFEGTANTVSDPVEIPAGLWRVTITTEGYIILSVMVLDGTCEAQGIYGADTLASLSRGQGVDGSDVLFMSEGCTAIWQTQNVTDPYTVTFQRMQ